MFIGSILLLVVSTIVSSFAEESPSNDALSAKRAPMGFQGMRGKKDLTSVDRDDISKRAPMGFQGMRGKKDSIASEMEENFLREDFDKRAPMGFQGMRGKKDYAMPDFEDSSVGSSYFRDDYDKRAPMGFQGMRGKKATSEEEYYKRAPMGFQGMRGKKSLEEVLQELEKRAVMGFQGMRGKKIYSALDYPEDYEKRALMMGFQGMRGKKDEYTDDWDKRAPMGFQGMRGKKALLDDLEEFEKRAIMGFQGMRGKKDDAYLDNNYVDYFMDPLDYEKRAPMGFQGMRGKKDSDKRAPMGFQGMRGKRNVGQSYGMIGSPSDFDDRFRTSMVLQGVTDRRDTVAPYQFEKRSPFRYFGSRGKKNPRWEIRGKFVGVRGKKWVAAPYDDSNRPNSLLDNGERIGLETTLSATLVAISPNVPKTSSLTIKANYLNWYLLMKEEGRRSN